MKLRWKKIGCALLVLMLVVGGSLAAASAKTLTEWLAGFDSGENWFGLDYAFDITDTAACWKLLQQPITVLNVGEKEVVYPLVEPGGKKVNDDPLGGSIAGTTAAVHVLGKNEDGWTLIEGLDEYDRLIRGYVRTRLLKTVTPNNKFGLIIDKLTQQMYVFVGGELFSQCGISTGLPTDETPFNETASGEYLISSWVGAFENESLICDLALRFNNGDLLHEVPYMLLGDGTKRYSTYEGNLGEKASHGCVRVTRFATPEGLDQRWLWDNLKKNTKVVIWDDDGRRYPYADVMTPLYYNADGGKYYHAYDNCSGVKPEYIPMAGFLYLQLDEPGYDELEPCPFCVPVKSMRWADAFNAKRGYLPEDPQ